MRGRFVLFVALAVLTALGGFYAGWSTSTPKAAAEATVTPPASEVGPSRGAGSGPSRSPAGSATKPSLPKPSPTEPSPPKGHGQPDDTPGTPPSSKPPRPAGPVRFGELAVAGGANDTSVSPDRRALTTTFDDLEVTVGGDEPAGSEAAKSFSMTVPLTDGSEGETLRVHVQGFAFVQDGVKGRLTLHGGPRTVIKGFLPGSNDSFLESLELPAIPGRTYELSAVVTAHRDGATDGQGYLNIVSVDAEIR